MCSARGRGRLWDFALEKRTLRAGSCLFIENTLFETDGYPGPTPNAHKLVLIEKIISCLYVIHLVFRNRIKGWKGREA